MSRAAHREVGAKNRGFDPIEVLIASAEGRLQRLLPLKYAHGRVTPFAFFRGAVSIMAADLGRLPHTGIEVQLCGDAHVQNSDRFAAPDGKLVFDYNDFDETIRGPFRMGTSNGWPPVLILAGREAEHKRPVASRWPSYLSSDIAASCRNSAADRFYRGRASDSIAQLHIRPISAALRQSERATPGDLLKKLTTPGNRGQPRFQDHRPVFWRVRRPEADEFWLRSLLIGSRYGPRAGISSICSVPSMSASKLWEPAAWACAITSCCWRQRAVDPLFLQIKQEMPSAYARYLPNAGFDHEGRRTAEGSAPFNHCRICCSVGPRWEAMSSWYVN